MVFGGIGGAEAEDAGDLGARRRKTGVLREVIDQAQDFGLAWGQFIHLGLLLAEIPIAVIIYSIRRQARAARAAWRSRSRQPHARNRSVPNRPAITLCIT